MSRSVAPLFGPFVLSKLSFANRVVMAPMTRQKSPGGLPGPEVTAYYRRRAESGAVRNNASTIRPASCGRVIALHCSGASAAQWRELGTMLGGGYELTAPEHYGGNIAGPWTGEHVFTLADEAERTIDLIDGDRRPVHLVGHSYGGGVALHVALRRPHAIASLTLYEPSAFQVQRARHNGRATACNLRSLFRRPRCINAYCS
jgi:pimeloyl-ACP methyl ester carboxylesterase